MVVKPSAEVEQVQKEEPVEEKKEEPAPVRKEEPKPEPVVEKPNLNFKNILFEFDSGVLKTDSYAVLDGIAREMRKAPSTKFVIDGHSSAEGTAEYNMSLSIDRANAVKMYLVNAGISPDNLSTKGYGATKPATSNDTEHDRALNRRVEIKVVK
ncbi:OmpA family protein [Olivibacter sitiensis]|uniref:OmpA family protein n=1 Tax=Olivibacter sitiensis TaxID=376470 RepID=UPI001FDEAAD0|nr:OmpA family protein [Olivibacter sitiensis]